MPILLHINSSPLETSISRELTREFVRTWKLAHPEGRVITRDLAASSPKPLDTAWIYASYTDSASRTPEQKAVLETSDQLIAELEQADEVVIGVAMHNFSIPASLKLWIDQVLRKDRTFTYASSGPQGLLQGKKATVLSASGGVYAAGTPAGSMNFMDPYLKTVLGFIGITDVTFISAAGAAQLMGGKISREAFLKPTLDRVRALAA
jgi:FMN-dependent NADH-azoreductase